MDKASKTSDKIETIGSREVLESWLKDKPYVWSQVIADRAALRVLPLVFGVFKESARLLSHDQKKRLALQIFRASFISWGAAKYPPHDISAYAAAAAVAAEAAAAAYATYTTEDPYPGDAAKAAVTAAYATAYAAYTTKAVARAYASDAIGYAGGSGAADAAKAAAYAADAAAYAAAAAAYAADAAKAAAPYAKAAAVKAAAWNAINAETQRRTEYRAVNLIQRPLWLEDVRDDEKYAANQPL